MSVYRVFIVWGGIVLCSLSKPGEVTTSLGKVHLNLGPGSWRLGLKMMLYMLLSRNLVLVMHPYCIYAMWSAESVVFCVVNGTLCSCVWDIQQTLRQDGRYIVL